MARRRISDALKGEGIAPGMKIGLFGGSFDPVHKGHLHVAETARRRLGLDQVWWLVSPQNPLKARRAGDFADRLRTVKQRAGGKGMVVSDIEARLGTRYTADLVDRLRQRFPRTHFVWVMGGDNLRHFHRWHRWQDILAALPVAVVSRPQDPIKAQLSIMARCYARSRRREGEAKKLPLTKLPAWTYLTEPLQSVSSTALRAR
ncbi:nicotinate-nucleotide adenylyltransferase [Maricaulis sp.]|uniref:nicotinate-nucleotide adenylyltransferase n=1 Tax=Maricaulis sp. TaxID=1486257 RepID=UPI0026318DF3|nr:nicotinate-nucleotide adenylyltransferase [Maricaulis sp.]